MAIRLRTLLFASAGASALLLAAGVAAAQTTSVTVPGMRLPAGSKVLNPGGQVLIIRPPSGLVSAPGRAHTNVEMVVPKGGYPPSVQRMRPLVGPPKSGYLWQTPASIACIYGVVTASHGCNPNLVTTVPTGGSKAIAVVDAFDLTTAALDLGQFDTQFGVPAGSGVTVIWGTGKPAAGCKNGPQPPNASGTGWDVEEDLDIEYAHAMAPNAKLYLVEAASNSTTDLLNAERVAVACVRAAGGGEVSNSWGSVEFSAETSYDRYFTGKDVVFFASSGDDTYPGWPATSPNVVAVGGTTLAYNPNTGNYQGQGTWYPNPDLFGLRRFILLAWHGRRDQPIRGDTFLSERRLESRRQSSRHCRCCRGRRSLYRRVDIQ